MVIGVVVVC